MIAHEQFQRRFRCIAIEIRPDGDLQRGGARIGRQKGGQPPAKIILQIGRRGDRGGRGEVGKRGIVRRLIDPRGAALVTNARLKRDKSMVGNLQTNHRRENWG